MKKVFFTFVITCIIGLPANADPAKTSAGKEIFNGKGMCAGCHVLKDAGSVGTIGPSLDQLKLNISIVTATVTE
ncbi:MAG: hypothetical protein O2871_03815, partial [bacterium]|nr:hypothetical protein [bacterium]